MGNDENLVGGFEWAASRFSSTAAGCGLGVDLCNLTDSKISFGDTGDALIVLFSSSITS